MSRYVFNPLTGELEYTIPSGSVIPEAAFNHNPETVIIQSAPRTSPFLIAIVITLVVVLLLFTIYTVWLIFIKTQDQNPADFFTWIVGG